MPTIEGKSGLSFENMIEMCGNDLNIIMKRHAPLVFGVVICIFQEQLDPAFSQVVADELNIAQSVERKKLELTDGGYPTSPQGDQVDMKLWEGTIGAVNKCGDDVLEIMHKYPGSVFAINITIFFETLPEEYVKTIERFRYLNTKRMEKIKETEDLFHQRLK